MIAKAETRTPERFDAAASTISEAWRIVRTAVADETVVVAKSVAQALKDVIMSIIAFQLVLLVYCLYVFFFLR